jgi:hypothetical protein
MVVVVTAASTGAGAGEIIVTVTMLAGGEGEGGRCRDGWLAVIVHHDDRGLVSLVPHVLLHNNPLDPQSFPSEGWCSAFDWRPAEVVGDGGEMQDQVRAGRHVLQRSIFKQVWGK